MATAAHPQLETTYRPADDGSTHINVYSRGRTELGRILTHFAHTPVDLPDHGWFASLEAYWYWLQCTDEHAREQLRPLHGYRAKKVGRHLRVPDFGRADELEFRRSIARATRAKICQTPGLAHAVAESTLPFVHYYLYPSRIVIPRNCGWIMETLEYYRHRLQKPR